MEDWKEAVAQISSNREYTIEENGIIRAPVKRFDVFRDKEHDIVIEVVCDGWVREQRDNPPAGTLKVHDGKISFRNKFSGYVGEARGVAYRHTHADSNSGGMETRERFTAHSIELEPFAFGLSRTG